jgi:hypothetical protein
VAGGMLTENHDGHGSSEQGRMNGDAANNVDPGFSYHSYAIEQVRATGYGGMRDQIMA